jgi:hypothetical protein
MADLGACGLKPMHKQQKYGVLDREEPSEQERAWWWWTDGSDDNDVEDD